MFPPETAPVGPGAGAGLPLLWPLLPHSHRGAGGGTGGGAGGNKNT